MASRSNQTRKTPRMQVRRTKPENRKQEPHHNLLRVFYQSLGKLTPKKPKGIVNLSDTSPGFRRQEYKGRIYSFGTFLRISRAPRHGPGRVHSGAQSGRHPGLLGAGRGPWPRLVARWHACSTLSELAGFDAQTSLFDAAPYNIAGRSDAGTGMVRLAACACEGTLAGPRFNSFRQRLEASTLDRSWQRAVLTSSRAVRHASNARASSYRNER